MKTSSMLWNATANVWENAGEHIDYALLLDGLKAEREQGITIDVAYRYFSTNNRSSSLPTLRDTNNTPVT